MGRDLILLSKLFYRISQTNIQKLRLKILNEFQTQVRKCNENLNHILQDTPADWLIDADLTTNQLDYLFEKDWLDQTIETFTRLFQVNHKN